MIKKIKEKKDAFIYLSSYIFCIKENLAKYREAKRKKRSTEEYIDNIELCINECSKYIAKLRKW